MRGAADCLAHSIEKVATIALTGQLSTTAVGGRLVEAIAIASTPRSIFDGVSSVPA